MAVEAGITDYWYKYVGLDGVIIGMCSFGESAPADKLFELFGITSDQVYKQAKEMLKATTH